jgi:cephalosporin-C deacetylase
MAGVPMTDLPLETLQGYRPALAEPADFDDFWSETLAQARAAGGRVLVEAADTPFSQVIVEDLTFPGFAGEPIRAWITRPRATGPLPAVVEYLGYNGGRGLPGERLHWAAAGYVHVLMDTRGQGSGWGSGGDTADPHGSGPSGAGFMTRGISDPAEYYYRRLFTDGVRLVDAVRGLADVDADRVAVTGVSQGGGTALAVAGLVPGLRAVMPDVPFLCDFPRSVAMTPGDPFAEIARYLGVHRDQDETVFRTLSYFDGANFAPRITAPALFSVALMDEVVLPSSVFAAYNRLSVDDRTIEVYPYNGHEGGLLAQWTKQARWLPSRLS